MTDRSWPHDPRLDPFRDAVWELRLDGRAVGYLTTQVSRMRSFPLLWLRQELLWYQVNWLVGRRDRIQEDYGPDWCTVAELEHARFEPDFGPVLEARGIEGAERERLLGDVRPRLANGTRQTSGCLHR